MSVKIFSEDEDCIPAAERKRLDAIVQRRTMDHEAQIAALRSRMAQQQQQNKVASERHLKQAAGSSSDDDTKEMTSSESSVGSNSQGRPEMHDGDENEDDGFFEDGDDDSKSSFGHDDDAPSTSSKSVMRNSSSNKLMDDKDGSTPKVRHSSEGTSSAAKAATVRDPLSSTSAHGRNSLSKASKDGLSTSGHSRMKRQMSMPQQQKQDSPPIDHRREELKRQGSKRREELKLQNSMKRVNSMRRLESTKRQDSTKRRSEDSLNDRPELRKERSQRLEKRGELHKQRSERGELHKQRSERGELHRQRSERGELHKQKSDRGELTKQRSERGQLQLHKRVRKQEELPKGSQRGRSNSKDSPMGESLSISRGIGQVKPAETSVHGKRSLTTRGASFRGPERSNSPGSLVTCRSELARERSQRLEKRSEHRKPKIEGCKKQGELPKQGERGSKISNKERMERSLNRSRTQPMWGSQSMSNGLGLEAADISSWGSMSLSNGLGLGGGDGSIRRERSSSRSASVRDPKGRHSQAPRPGSGPNRGSGHARSRSSSVSRRRRHDVVAMSQHQQMLALASTSAHDPENSAELDTEPDLFLPSGIPSAQGADTTKERVTSEGDSVGEEEVEGSDRKSGRFLKKMKGKISKVLGPSSGDQNTSN